MSFSTETFTGVAAQQTYVFGTGTGSSTSGLKFLSSDHLSVTVAGVTVTFTVNSDRTSFTVTGAVIAGGESIVVTRSTPVTESGRLVNFEDLSHLRQADLDTASLQLLYIAQESLDAQISGVCLMQGAGGQWDALTKRIQNVAAGTLSTDAVNKGQLDAASIAAGDLPVVSAADNDKSLWVVAGAWAIRTPTQARTHLGLGTAAVLNAGVAAGNVIQLDGSARYPSNDGRNIDLTNNAVTTTLNLRYRSTVGIVVQTSELTPNTDATGTWSEGASSRLTPGTLTSLDNSSDVVVDNGAKKVTLSAGTWELEYSLRVYNSNAVDDDIQQLKMKVTDDVDSGAQVVYDDAYATMGVESGGTGVQKTFTLTGTLLLKLASGGAICFRASQNTTAEIKVSSMRAVYRKVSSSTT